MPEIEPDPPHPQFGLIQGKHPTTALSLQSLNKSLLEILPSQEGSHKEKNFVSAIAQKPEGKKLQQEN